MREDDRRIVLRAATERAVAIHLRVGAGVDRALRVEVAFADVGAGNCGGREVGRIFAIGGAGRGAGGVAF